jgi:hypothetical protein
MKAERSNSVCLLCHVQAIADHFEPHPRVTNGTSQHGPIRPEQRLAARQGDGLAAEHGKLMDEIQSLRSTELLVARAAGARTTVDAMAIASQGDLPDADLGDPRATFDGGWGSAPRTHVDP